MTEQNGAVAPKSKKKQQRVGEGLVLPGKVDPKIAEQLAEQARSEGVDLVGPDGLLGDLTKQVLEAGLEVEMAEHLGYDKHAVEGRDGGNSRNGTRSKTVLTEIGPVEVDVPRDRDGSFEPKTVRKRQRRLRGVDAMVLSLTAKGVDDRRSPGASRGDVWDRGVSGNNLEDHRRGDRGDERVAQPAP